MESYAYLLRRIAENAGCQPLKTLAAKPGIRAIYRVTAHYPDGRAANTIATLTRSATDATLEVVYQGRFNNRPIQRRVTLESYDLFTRSFTPGQFDKLPDQPDIPLLSTDLCLIERASGSFVRGVIVSPEHATGTYAVLLENIRRYLPEALREIS